MVVGPDASAPLDTAREDIALPLEEAAQRLGPAGAATTTTVLAAEVADNPPAPLSWTVQVIV